MAVCDVCQKNSVFPEGYGSLTLCKKCSLKLLSPKWKNKVYTTNEKVAEQQQSALRLAIKAEFPQKAIEELDEAITDAEFAAKKKQLLEL